MAGTEMLIECMLSGQMSKYTCALRLPGQPQPAKVMTGSSPSYVSLTNRKDTDGSQETVHISKSSTIL